MSDQASGDVTVLLNDAAHSFSQSLRFRADPGASVAGPAAGSPGGSAVQSLAQSVSVVAGDFTGDGRDDLVVVNAGAHSFSVLPNDGNGFGDPALALTTSTSGGLAVNNQPGAVVAGDFNRNGRLDLAVLMQDTGQVWIYTNNGNGTFTHTFTIPVGDEATGLSVVPGSGPGLLDLLVGNGFGDVLHLQGKGDGTFQISGNRVSLSVVPNLLGAGQAGVLVGNQQDNSVTVQAATAGGTQFTTVQKLGSAGGAQLAPGDVSWAVLDKGATLPDAVVVSSGSNAVEVYRTTGVSNGAVSFAPTPQTLFVGTDPVSVTVADVTGDSIPDLLVANQGSNDISVIFGSYDADGDWVGIPGPRLKSGGDGPLAVAVRDLSSDGIPDLVVTNGGSGTITLLPGVGQGFFDDQHPQTLFNLGDALIQAPTFTADSGVGYAVTVGGELLRVDLSDVARGASVAFAGADVLAARALSGGEVVVAVAGGAVKVLGPEGNGESLGVIAELQAQGGVPALPSSLEVLQTESGHFEVLVSSQGSDNIFVFAASGASASAGVVGSLAGTALAATPIQVFTVPIGTSAVSTITLAAIAGVSGTVGSAAVTAAVGSTTGLSLSDFSSADAGSRAAGSAAILVPIQGNSYSTVAVLDFGSQRDDDLGNRAPMPWLSTSYPIGNTSPLTRLVIGQEEALRQYRGSEGAETSLADPWREDLFHLRPRSRPPIGAPQEDDGSPEARLPDPQEDGPSPESEALAVVLAAMLWAGSVVGDAASVAVGPRAATLAASPTTEPRR